MSELRFCVLGRLEVWRGGQRLDVPGGRRCRVLAALLVHAGAPVSVDALVEAAWDADVPADPRAALYTVVSRLRGLLGDHVLSTEPDGYRIDVAADSVDAMRFERLCRTAATVGPEQAAVLLDEGLGLWRGPAYAEFAEHDFAAVDAQRLELLRADAQEEQARVALELGDAQGAARVLASLLDRHPFREHAVELLMTALHRGGRTSDALACYRNHRRRMAEELGLDPAPALQNLEARILGQSPPGRAPAKLAGAPAWLDTSTAFLGRERELASLVEAVTASRVVTVTGTGGVGKTRLVAEALPVLSTRTGLPVVVVELAAAQHGRAAAAVADALSLPAGGPERARAGRPAARRSGTARTGQLRAPAGRSGHAGRPADPPLPAGAGAAHQQAPAGAAERARPAGAATCRTRRRRRRAGAALGGGPAARRPGTAGPARLHPDGAEPARDRRHLPPGRRPAAGAGTGRLSGAPSSAWTPCATRSNATPEFWTTWQPVSIRCAP